MAGLAQPQASSAAWPSMGFQAENALNGGWILDQRVGATGGFTANVSPASSGGGFYSTGDALAFYPAGRLIRVIDTSTHYCEVLSSSSSAVAGTTSSTIVTITNVVSGTTALSTGTLVSVEASPLLAGFSGNLGPPSTGSATFPGHRFPGAYGGIGSFVDASTRLAFSVLGTQLFAMSTGAFLTATDNAYDIGASAASRPRSIYWATALIAPGSAASAGDIRLRNDGASVFGIVARNAANTADIDMLHLNASNILYIGGAYAGSAASVSMNDFGTMRVLTTSLADATGHMGANQRVWTV